ncbi:MAG: S41 family peptidase [Bacteroidota bacterium]|nr:S41 family peptidase [Bacteroidota bacterium]
MRKTILTIYFGFLIFSVSCQTKSYKSNNEKEFDNGSNITLINISGSTIEDLDILGKVWGFLKYYHPVIAKGEYNWDYELFRIMPKILKSKNQTERNDILSEWVNSLGKIESAEVMNEERGEIKMSPDRSWIKNKNLGQKLNGQLTDIRNCRRTNENYYIGLTRIGNPDFNNENSYSTMKYPDAGFRLLSLYRYWNIIQYYFPYKYLIGEDWNEVLKEFIPKFLNASNELEYELTVLSIIARVHDSHAIILGGAAALKNYVGINKATVKIKFVENKAVVTAYDDSVSIKQSKLKIGDIIETINNKSVEEIVREKLPYTPASNYPTQLRNIEQNLLRTNDSILNVGYKRGDAGNNLTIKCYPAEIDDISMFQNLDTCFKLLTNDIAYFNPGSVKKEYLPEIMPEILWTRGLIIDFRCYPSDDIVNNLSEYFLPYSTKFVKASKGSIILPGLFTMTDAREIGMENKDFYKGKVIIIVNEITQSSAEFHTMAFRTFPEAKVIGSTTAGADGNTSKFFLPGGIETKISGLGVYYPDGTETQRVGIVPDIEVKTTIKGITEKRDELLEKAIEIINEK